MKYAVAVLSICVFAVSGCAVTTRVPQPQSAPNHSDFRYSEEFELSAEQLFQKREKTEKIDRLLRKIRGNGS